MTTKICPTCKGNTTIRRLCPLDACTDGKIHGFRGPTKCKQCDGEGWVTRPCTDCRGGVVPDTDSNWAVTQTVTMVRK